MSLESLANEFVDLCNQGKNFDVMEKFYADNIVSVEGDGKETAGKTPVIDKSRKWATTVTIHGEKVLGPYYNGPHQFAVHFSFDVTHKSTNKRVILDEVAVYTVNPQFLITREVFYYAGTR